MVVPSQTCIRCRSRRMKCDLRLPKCGSCLHAGVECLTIDPGLEEGVPRSYIHSLQQRAEELERQIQIQKDKIHSPHFPALVSIVAPLKEEYGYVGLGTSLSLFDQLCRAPLLFPAGSSSFAIPNNADSTHTSESSNLFAILPVECDHLLTPPVQQNLLGCFFERISSDLPPVLSQQHENMFRHDINPLLTYSIDPNPWLRIILLYVYATSARYLSRDLHPEYAYLEHACQTELQKALPISFHRFYAYEQHAFDQVTVACLSILYELVGPGRSRISLDLLNTFQMLLAVASYPQKEDDNRLQLVERLAFFLSQVEASICLHYKRPSAQFYAICALSNHDTTWLDVSMELLHAFQGHYESDSEALLNSILSKHGHMHNLSQANRELDESELLLILNQHPIFSTDLSWIMNTDPAAACACSIRLFEEVAQAARSYLQLMSTKQKTQQTVLCVWLTVEQIMQAGFVWITYLLCNMNASSKTSSGTEIDCVNPLEPLIQCNFLLVYLTGKWNPGRPYYAAWELIYTKTVATLMDIHNQEAHP